MADLKEHLNKDVWGDDLLNVQDELLSIRARITALRQKIANLDTTMNASPYASANDITLITNVGTFINAAAVTNFEAHIDASLPVV